MNKPVKIKIVQVPGQDASAVEEFGILYPDGKIEWQYTDDIQSRSGQRAAQEAYNEKLVFAHTGKKAGTLQFVKRIVTTSYGTPFIAKTIRP